MVLPNIYLYSLFLMKLHPFLLLLSIYFALNSSMPGEEFTLLVFPVFSFKEAIDFGTSRKNNTVEKQPESSQGGF